MSSQSGRIPHIPKLSRGLASGDGRSSARSKSRGEGQQTQFTGNIGIFKYLIACFNSKRAVSLRYSPPELGRSRTNISLSGSEVGCWKLRSAAAAAFLVRNTSSMVSDGLKTLIVGMYLPIT